MNLFRTYKNAVWAFAFLVVLSSMGLRLDLHYCMGQLKSARIFGSHTSCLMENMPNSCDSPKLSTANHQHQDKKGCCDNEQLKIDAGDQLMKAAVGVQFQHMLLFVTVFISYVFSFDVSQVFNPFFQYKPPLLYYDILLIINTFLI